MKAGILSDNLKTKLSFLNHAVSGRAQLPILSNFLIKATKNGLEISATDLEIGITAVIQASVEEEGETTVPAKTFSEIIANIGSEKITLEVKNQSLEVKGKKINAVFQTMSPVEFPIIYEKKGREIASVKKEDAVKDFSKISFAASQGSGRPALSGVLIRKEKEKIVLVATDGYRLSLKNNTLSSIAKNLDKDILVSARAIKEFLLMPQEEKETKIYLSEESNQVVFSGGDTELVGRLIEAEYPSYEKIIPTEQTTKTFFDKNEMENAVKICSVFARDTANIVKISVKKDKIIVSANTPSVGENTVEVDAKTTGEENEIAFNSRYLLELFSNIEEEEMSFEMTGPLNPGVFKIAKDDSFLHLIMPIRVQEQ